VPVLQVWSFEFKSQSEQKKITAQRVLELPPQYLPGRLSPQVDVEMKNFSPGQYEKAKKAPNLH
jgi:hypothetical protein